MENQSEALVTPKEALLQGVESQKLLCDRYSNIVRISPEGGSGCFSLIFTADDTHSKSKNKKRVVIKFFDPFCREDYRRQCFIREAELLHKLQVDSPKRNILPIVQGRTEINLELRGLPIPMMFYVSHLADMDVERFVYNSQEYEYLRNMVYFRDMCKAVQRIHANNICHRDLKPENFFILKHRVYLADFGTARKCDGSQPPICDNYSHPAGDSRYIAPELMCGLQFKDSLNFTADFYSLGLILYELFTKTQLGPEIFKDRLDLMRCFFSTPESNRVEYFDKLIKDIDRNRPLPDIRTANSEIPKALAPYLNSLYKSLAALDYKCRLTDFSVVFTKIQICTKILEMVKAGKC